MPRPTDERPPLRQPPPALVDQSDGLLEAGPKPALLILSGAF